MESYTKHGDYVCGVGHIHSYIGPAIQLNPHRHETVVLIKSIGGLRGLILHLFKM